MLFQVASMKVQGDSPKWIKQCPNTLNFLFLLLILGSTATSSQSVKCPFQHLYHFGDGYTDIGNSICVFPWGPFLPAARLPYGVTFPGRPTGRWSDGLIDIDFAAKDLGLPNITAYLSMNKSSSYDGVIFSVARSPVLDPSFFMSRGVDVPPYVVPLRVQLRWFKTYLTTMCSTPTACSNLLQNSLVLFGDIEGNDIGYPLTQGKSIQEVKTYIPFITQESIKAARELINMGATRVIVPGNVPLGCYPYILTALPSNNTADYDDLGCLKGVNDLILAKNNETEQAVRNLSMEFPSASITYSNIYEGVQTYINQTISGPNAARALKACCGIGGKYNYDNERFCGSRGAHVCPNPEKYIFWDGIHLTQEAYRRIEQILIEPALPLLNCTLPPSGPAPAS